jgi:hypothetical protein
MVEDPNSKQSPGGISQRRAPPSAKIDKTKPRTRTATNEGRPGVGALLFGTLERILPQVHPRVRDFIGIVLVMLVALYVVNGVAMPTYIQGQIYVDGRRY